MQNLLQAPFSTVKTMHFTGIGGIGMSGIAELFHNLGFIVQGSDIKNNTTIKRLRSLGVKVYIGHKVENIKNVDVLVISSAITPLNVEYCHALSIGMPIFRRGKILAELMRFKWSIAVAGTHGKTTTTSLVSHILHTNDLDPTAIIGGIVNSWGQNSRFGASNWLVAESDESDGSFLDLPATISIVTNIESEHLDHYGNYENVKDHFVRFIQNIPFYGFSVLCIDNPGIQDILPRIKQRKIITYGISPQADYRAINVRYNHVGVYFDIQCQYQHRERIIKDIYLPMYGHHNVLNTVAAIAVADNIGIEESKIKESIRIFEGIKRRFTKIGTIKDISFIDDYAHHPSEIEAVIKAADHIFSGHGKIISVVQPHRYSRLKDYFDDFSKCFNKSDYVLILDVYPAGEDSIDGINSDALVKNIRGYGHKNVKYVTKKSLAKDIKTIIDEDNINMVLFMGAGDLTTIAQETVNKLK